MATMGGNAIVLDRDDINTDEIIPARYLTEVDKKTMAPYLLEDLKMDGFDADAPEVRGSKVLISRANFGCGSSREHAVWAFTENDYEVVISENFARIFRQNAYNSGLLAIELPKAEVDKLIKAYEADKNLEIQADIDAQTIQVKSSTGNWELNFEISSFYKSIVKAGGWINFADKAY